MIVAGFGFRAGATTASLQSALDAARAAGRAAGRAGEWPITHLATIADKAEALVGLSAAFALPLIVITSGDIAGLVTPTLSPASQQARGTGSVAEACALAAAGGGARLLAPRSISHDRMATCALAAGGTT